MRRGCRVREGTGGYGRVREGTVRYECRGPWRALLTPHNHHLHALPDPHPRLSDIDLVVTNVPKPTDNTGWMTSRSQAASNNPVTLLEHQLKTQPWVSSVNALPNASVPIIKIQVSEGSSRFNGFSDQRIFRSTDILTALPPLSASSSPDPRPPPLTPHTAPTARAPPPPPPDRLGAHHVR